MQEPWHSPGFPEQVSVICHSSDVPVGPRMRSATLLIVDDQAVRATALQGLVTQHLPACEVLMAADVPAALERVVRGPLDLVLVSVQPPGSAELELCQRLRADPATANTGIILLSDHPAPAQLRFAGLEAGADDFLAGPHDDGELVARIRALLRRTTAPVAVRTPDDELRESLRALANLMGNLPGMVYRCRNDRNWTMQLVSAGCTALTGYQPADLLENRRIAYAELIHPDDRDDVWTEVQTALHENRPFQLLYRITALGGEEKWVWEQGAGVPSPTGELVALEGFIMDTTARKRADEDRAQLQEQLHQMQKIEVIGQLAGGIAHDFNNLLTAILGNAEQLMEMLPPGGAARAALDSIERAALQAAGVTRGLLTFTHRLPVERKRVDLAQVVAGAARLLRRMIPAAVDLQTDTASERPLWVNADATQLQQVVMNLAINARDSMPAGGTLRIEVAAAEPSASRATDDPHAAQPAWARLTVSDTGTGMTAEVLAHVFEPFFTTKPPGQGTGLGLSITQRIVSEHGGRIEVQSAVGAGSTFVIDLPRVRAADESARAAQPAPPPPGHGEVILVAEDSRPILELIKRALERFGYEVVATTDGVTLLERHRLYRYSTRLLVLDLDLPRRGGLECLRELRSAGVDTPVIIITGRVEAGLHAHLGPGTVLLLKPFSMAELGNLVSRMLRGDTLELRRVTSRPPPAPPTEPPHGSPADQPASGVKPLSAPQSPPSSGIIPPGAARD